MKLSLKKLEMRKSAKKSLGAIASHASKAKESIADKVAAAIEENEDVDEDDFELEEDIFSLWFVCEIKSIAFLLCLGVFLVQVSVLMLIMTDILEDDDRAEWEADENYWNIPVDVDRPVAVSQCLALIIAVVSQDDVLMSIDALFSIVFKQQVVNDLDIPHASLFRWRFYNSLRWLEGMMTLFVSLVIVIQTDNVLDIFLNFAAVEFVSNLDNAAFTLAATGFLGLKIKSKTNRVRKITFERDRSCWRSLAIQSVFIGNLLILILVWAYVRMQQLDGHYLQNESCRTIMVEFGDEVFDITSRMDDSQPFPAQLHYAYFSGAYVAVTKGFTRPMYYERGSVDDPNAGRFYYCSAAKSWMFTIPALESVIPKQDDMPCSDGWLLHSPITESFTLEDAEMDNWKVIAGSGTIGTTQEALSIKCGECSRDSDCSLNGVCGADGRCDCFRGWNGRTCSVEAPFCSEVIWIQSGKSSTEYSEVGPFELVTKDGRRPILIYDRPVYQLTRPMFIQNWCSDGTGEVYAALIYSGTRWFSAYFCQKEMDSIRKNFFHSYWSNSIQKAIVWYSDPTDSEIPTGFEWNEISDTRSPGNFGLFGASSKVNARFECADIGCNPNLGTGVCGDQGTCERDIETDSTHCVCNGFATGYFCEYGPYSDYIAEQANVTTTFMLNSTNYVEFLQATEGNNTIRNVYYERYIDHQVQDYYRKQAGLGGVETSKHPVLPPNSEASDGNDRRKLHQHSRRWFPPKDTTDDLSNRRFRL